jgi:hypothetical protein
MTFGFAQFVSFRSSSFLDPPALFSTVFDLPQASFADHLLLRPSVTFASDSINSFGSFLDHLSLFSTVLDDEDQIGNGD